MKQKEKVLMLTDMETFYASVEKAENPAIKYKPVLVSGDPKRRSGIILAACPIAKKFGVKTAETLWEAKRKCPNAVVIQPRMQHYIDVSVHITDILERYTDLVEPFSIDEQFLDVTGSLKLFGPPHVIARKIQQDILKETGVWARVGISSNKVLCKMACDNFAKKNKSGIFEITNENMKQTLWKLPIGKMFGVGSRMENHFERMGITTIGRLANYPLDSLKKRWGKIGHSLWQTANGIDPAPVTTKSHDTQKAIGHGMTLPRDYSAETDIHVVLLELCEEVCRRARVNGYMGYTVSIGCMGSSFDFPTGFHRQKTLLSPTNSTLDVFEAVWDLFMRFWDRQPVRRLSVNLSGLSSDSSVQLSLFEVFDERKRKLGYVMDDIKKRFGATAILRAASLTDAGLARDRAMKIGGHYK